MEDRDLRSAMLESEKKEKHVVTSRLVIEDNTIYEIDLECQNRKQSSEKKRKLCNVKKGV